MKGVSTQHVYIIDSNIHTEYEYEYRLHTIQAIMMDGFTYLQILQSNEE